MTALTYVLPRLTSDDPCGWCGHGCRNTLGTTALPHAIPHVFSLQALGHLWKSLLWGAARLDHRVDLADQVRKWEWLLMGRCLMAIIF